MNEKTGIVLKVMWVSIERLQAMETVYFVEKKRDWETPWEAGKKSPQRRESAELGPKK